MAKILKSPDGDFAEIEITIKAKSDKAVLVYSSDTGQESWIPLSQVEDLDETNGTILIPEWLAIEKELV